VLAACWLGAACAPGAPSLFSPRGPGALDVERFSWILFGISAVVTVVVLMLMAVAILRRKRRSAEEVDMSEPRWGERFILIAGVFVSGAILVGTFTLNLREMAALAKPKTPPAFTIQVIGHMWWWEARYPNGTVTANEIHIPVGQAVSVDLTTDDVIHSFWVPQLQVKMDQIPGHTNHFWLQASAPGRYRGQCAQFCGLQHAHMLFYVVADPPSDFQTWLAGQALPARPPDSPEAARGLQVFETNTCVGCHAIRGTAAQARVGPDLTHLQSRQTLASGTIDDTAQSLSGWISNPQGVKPGVIMPPTQLSSRDLADLVAYLTSLK
jgi:cytochrome c oxidase subunit 2